MVSFPGMKISTNIISLHPFAYEFPPRNSFQDFLSLFKS